MWEKLKDKKYLVKKLNFWIYFPKHIKVNAKCFIMLHNI